MCISILLLAYVPSDLFSVSAVMKELSVLQKKWRIIGEELSLEKRILDNIRTYYSEPENHFREVLSERVERQATSWGDIIAVLRTPRVGQSQLADQLEAKYCPSELANLQHSTMNVVCQYTALIELSIQQLYPKLFIQ